jgi:hypothetical protein
MKILAAGNGFRQSGRGRWVVLALIALACAAAPCHGVEEDGDPLAMHDPDHAAGRKAIEAKDWNAAIFAIRLLARRPCQRTH